MSIAAAKRCGYKVREGLGMNVKEYIKDHKSTIKKAVIIGVPTAAGIAIGCGTGVIPYKQIGGVAIKAGRKIPVRMIGSKAKDGVLMVAGTEAATKAGQLLKKELKRELKGNARRIVRKKIKESRIANTPKRNTGKQGSKNMT